MPILRWHLHTSRYAKFIILPEQFNIHGDGTGNDNNRETEDKADGNDKSDSDAKKDEGNDLTPSGSSGEQSLSGPESDKESDSAVNEELNGVLNYNNNPPRVVRGRPQSFEMSFTTMGMSSTHGLLIINGDLLIKHL